MINKNEEYIDNVIAIGMDGEGIIKRDDYAVFVPFSFLNEKIEYKVLKVDGKCAFGKLSKILEPSSRRVEVKCPVYKTCGGCDISHVDYESQLMIKQQKIKNCFIKIAGLDVDVDTPVFGEKEFRYRNKLQLPVGENKDGQNVIGFYARNSHRIVPITDCMINPTWTKEIISVVKNYMEKFSLHGYDEEKKCGDIREITVKEIDNNLIITLVSFVDHLKGTDYFIEKLKENLGCVFSVYQNVNKGTNNNIYGETFKLLYGEKEYYSSMQGIKYPIGVRSFMQVNGEVCEKLYDRVKSELNADSETVVIDAYSGAGLMTAMLAKSAKRGIGIEIVPEAVELANVLKKENGLDDKITNFCGKCEELLPDIINKEKQKGSKIALVLDPPRKGCDIKVVEAVKKSDIDRIVYVSCKPQSLARDVGLLTGALILDGKEIKRSKNADGKYRIVKLIPFDMFPQTKHVETLCVLEKV